MLKYLPLLALMSLSSQTFAKDIVRVGNLKFAHYGAVSYMSQNCAKYDLDVQERVFPKGIDIMPAIVAGEIDVAASAADAAIAGRAGGTPIYAVAGFAQGGARIVVGNKAGIKSIKDMKGKKIGVARGGAQELLLLAELSKNKLTWSDQPGRGDVQIVYMAFADLNQALSANQIDGMSQSEPQSSQAINKGWGVELMKPYDTEMGEPIRALVMTEKMYKNKAIADRFMKCFVETTKYFIENPAVAEKFVVEKMFKGQITNQDFKDAMGNAEYTYDLSVQHIQITTDFMQKYGVGRMNNPPKAADWVKLDLLANAKKSLGVK